MKNVGQESLGKGAACRSRAPLWRLSVFIVLGWTLCDAFVFLTRDEPLAFFHFLPTILLACGLAALVGWIARSWYALAGLILLAGAAAIAPRTGLVEWSLAERWLPRAIVLILAALGLGRTLWERTSLGALRIGLCLGVIACALITALMHGFAASLWLPGLTAVVCLAAGYLPSLALRLGGSTLAILCFLFLESPTRILSPPQTSTGLAPATPANTDRPSLFLIVLDTVSARHLAPYGYERVTTPALDAFASKHATRYSSARSTSSFTLPSHASMLTGLFPSQHGAKSPSEFARPIHADVPTLPERLHASGFQTAAILANSGYLSPFFGFSRGFEYFDHRSGGVVGSYLSLTQLAGRHLRVGHLKYRDAKTITDEAIRWLDEERRSQSFFLMLNYMDAHKPYHPPKPYDRAFSDEVPLDPLQPKDSLSPLLYDRELLFLDSQLDRLFAHLQEKELFDSAAIIVTADHGEALGGHGLEDHAWHLYDDVVHVPLYVKPAGVRTRVVDDAPISGRAIHDLALGLVGLAANETSDQEDGALPSEVSLIGEWYPWEQLQPRRIRWAQRQGIDPERDLLAWHQDGLKFIVSSTGEVEVYDLNLDPDELQPLEIEADRREEARERAERWWQAHQTSEHTTREMDEQQAEHLRELGYGG